MKRQREEKRRARLLRQMQELAGARVNDAVKLAYLKEEQLEVIDRLDLMALTEFKRSGNGAVEIKFSDRMKAMEQLLALTKEGGEGQLAAFLESVERHEEEREE